MWQELLTITDYKKKDNHVADINAALPDELNIFFSCLELNNSELRSRALKHNEDYMLMVHGGSM
jgi:hypothetical protein